jgi:hypothetical protein
VSLLVLLLALFLPPDSLGALAGNSLRWVLGLLTIVLLALAILLRKRAAENDRQPAPVSSAASARRWWALVGALLFVVGLANIWIIKSPTFITSTQVERELYQFLEGLPVDALIGGNPCDLDGMPLFAKRMVLTSCERPRSNAITLDSLNAYYSAEPEQIAVFCEQYGLDYLVVNSETFKTEFLQEGDYYFEPFNSLLYEEISQRQSFALDSIPQQATLFSNATYSVIPCDGLALASQAAAE